MYGTCVNNLAGYTCRCNTGYTGSACENGKFISGVFKTLTSPKTHMSLIVF